MSEQENNIAVIKKGYDAFTAGDFEALMATFDDNIVWIQPGRSTVSGSYHGKGELAEYLASLGQNSPTVTPRRFIADGDTVVVLSEATVGGETSQDVEVYTMRGGKTARVEVYGDTALMERVYGMKRVSGDQRV